MEYNRFGDTIYLRVDRGEEIMETLLAVCQRESIQSATFSGIGGCGEAQLQTFLPEKGAFKTEMFTGALELVSLLGNVICDEKGERFWHAHALFTFREGNEPRVCGGHLKSATVRYTAEIELRPVTGGTIGRTYDPETGTGFWKLHRDKETEP